MTILPTHSASGNDIRLTLLGTLIQTAIVFFCATQGQLGRWVFVIMKQFFAKFEIICCLMIVIPNVWAADDGDFITLFNRLDIASRNKDFCELVTIMSELDNTQIWSFGAGLGPTTSESLQVSIARIADTLLADGISDTNSIVTLCGGGKWIKSLVLSPDEYHILSMLQDDNAALREIGILKCSRLGNISNEIIACLRDIAKNDRFLQFVRKPFGRSRGKPSPPGLWRSGISFPLREMSAKILTEKGYPTELPQGELIKSGILIIAKMWDDTPCRRDDIMQAVYLLEKDCPEVMAILELATQENIPASIKVFINAVHAGGL